MTRMLPYVPLFIALSTSSPFWQARGTGLKGYRLAAYDELPRTGLPELFRGASDYSRDTIASSCSCFQPGDVKTVFSGSIDLAGETTPAQ